MALSERDRDLLSRCLRNEGQSWQEFVDRFMGLVYQVVEHTIQARGFQLDRQDRDDLVANVFVALVEEDRLPRAICWRSKSRTATRRAITVK